MEYWSYKYIGRVGTLLYNKTNKEYLFQVKVFPRIALSVKESR